RGARSARRAHSGPSWPRRGREREQCVPVRDRAPWATQPGRLDREQALAEPLTERTGVAGDAVPLGRRRARRPSDERERHVRRRQPLDPEARAVQLTGERRPVVPSPVVAGAKGAEAAVRPDEERAVGTEDAPQLAQVGLELILVEVLEHVVQDDEVERPALVGQLAERPDAEVGLGQDVAGDRDRLRTDVDPAEAVEDAEAARPGEEAAGAAAGVEEALAAPPEPRPAERRLDRQHAAIP